MTELPAELRPVVIATGIPRSHDDNDNGNYNNNDDDAARGSHIHTTNAYSGGFSSSICLGLFEHHAESHSDCCALACCGMLLADRNRYLLTQQLPPPLWQRVFQYIVIPIFIIIFILIVISPTTTMSDASKNQIQSSRVLIILLTIILLTWMYYCQAVSKRREVRLMIQQRLIQQQQESTNINMTMAPLDMSDIQASHSTCCCCGCYPRDRPTARRGTAEYDWNYDDNNNANNNNNNDMQKRSTPTRDVCYGLWEFLANLCCGWLCNCWCQCFGMCALAQEDRELQLLLQQSQQQEQYLGASPSTTIIPTPFQRDYITMQPYSEYYPRIQRVRQQNFYGIWEHGKALSLLSSHLLKWVFGVLALVIVSSFLPILDWIKPLQLIVVFGTLGQALILLFAVHWIYHRFDLSLDAVIKYFASGFCLCTGMAMVYELLVSLVFGIFLLALKLIIVMKDTLRSSSSSQQHAAGTDDATSSSPSDYYKNYFTNFDRHHLGLAIFGAFINAYFVAAAVEELAKYFSFWMVEHPDFSVLQKNGGSNKPQRNGANNGTNGMGAETTYETIDMEGQPRQPPPQQQEEDTTTTAMVVSHNDYMLAISPTNSGDINDGNNNSRPMTTTPSLSAVPRRTHQSLGSAITVAMVTTALGFACAENLLYVFAYSPPGFANEVATLIARSIFPVHPLCAALQSLGVVHRDIVLPNGKRTFGLGRVLFPAWLLHGTFDFVLMAVAAYVNFKVPPKASSSSTDDHVNRFSGSSSSSSSTGQSTHDEQLAAMANLISLVVSVVIVVMGFIYYQCAALRQRRQLRALDEASEDISVGIASAVTREPQDESASWLI